MGFIPANLLQRLIISTTVFVIVVAAIGVADRTMLVVSFGDLLRSPVALSQAASLGAQGDEWIFEETFDGDPASPSQLLLPRTFDYAVTHRTHPKEHFTKIFDAFPADHGSDCAGPNPNVSPLPQHLVYTSHLSTSSNPDQMVGSSAIKTFGSQASAMAIITRWRIPPEN